MVHFLVILLVSVSNVHCFTSITITSTSTRRQHHHARSSTSHNAEIFVVSLEGIVLDMVDWRSRHGIQAALDTWPHLHDLVGDQQEWLRNKMKALSHVLTRRPGLSPTCDYAMLARLLLEEQALDQGRSSGKTGKYASRFHPSSSNGSTSSPRQDTVGSRPLTVGEIEANWCDGASLSETLLTRYIVNGKSPVPVLQTCIEKQSLLPPKVH
jgi:hypothetical protein